MRGMVLLLSGVAALSMTGAAGAADFEPDYGSPPVYNAPVAPPTYAPPVYNPPTYDAPIYNAPTYNAPYAPPPVYQAPPLPAPRADYAPYGGYHSRAAVAEQCRTYTKSRVDEWGREVRRRVRVCEEVTGAAPSYAPAPYAPAPAPAGYYYDGYGPPRPPLEVGVPYYR